MNTILWAGSTAVRWFFVVALFLVLNTSAVAQFTINYWTNAFSGRWDDASSWSLGFLPESSQGVVIQNEKPKTVLIDQTTAQSFSNSMTVAAFAIQGENTLLISNVPASSPFHVANGSTFNETFIFTNCTVAMVNSSVLYDAFLHVQGGRMTQGGGTVQAGSFYIPAGEYDLTNGTFSVFSGEFQVAGGMFNQFSGNVSGSDLSVYHGGSYHQLAGTIVMNDDTGIGDGSTFIQDGGTNNFQVYGLGVGGEYVLNNGRIDSGSLGVGGNGVFTVNGGSAFFSNANVDGTFINRPRGDGVFGQGKVLVTGGSFTVPGQLQLYGAYANLSQQNGLSMVNYLWLGSLDGKSEVDIGGGTLICTNVAYEYLPYYGSGADIIQTGGEFRVEQLFSFGGQATTRFYGSFSAPQYSFQAGTLYASNIDLEGLWVIGSSAQGNRINNPGFIQMGGTIQIGDTTEHLGRFILVSNAVINFQGTSTTLTFANSSSEVWNSGVMLVVSNWNGSFVGGGNQQLKFGASASGLTTAQLNQMVFVNPVSIPAGQYPARILSNGEVVPDTGTTNYWIKGATGAWQETNSWSLHALPSASQSIFITGSWLNVHIDPDTKNNFPQTLTVGDVTVAGSATTFMLNYISENIPFHALNGLTVAGESPTNRNTFFCLQSGAYVDNGGLYVTNGQVSLDGGFIRVTNSDTWLDNGEFYMTNGEFDVGTLWFGSSPTNHYAYDVGSFFQYGGTVTASNVHDGGAGTSNSYSIFGGVLDAGSINVGEINPAYFSQYGGAVSAGSVTVAGLSPGTFYTMQNGQLVSSALSIGGDYGGCQFIQNGGTVSAASLSAGASHDRTGGSGYVLNSGSLHTTNVSLSDYGEGYVQQNGGTHTVAGMLSIHGVWDFHIGLIGSYRMTAGSLTASNLDLSGGEIRLTNNASASFNNVVVSGESGVDVDSAYGFINLLGGSFSCGIFRHTGLGGAQIVQTGGLMVVSNLLEFGGRGGGYYTAPLNYYLNGGTLSASNIEVTANLNINSAVNPAVINLGYFKLGGMLAVAAADVQFGRFILESNAVINFTGGVTTLRFADSHTQSWGSGMYLAVSNWNGSVNGGGSHQLRFGTNAAALTAEQVSQIRFVNPGGFVPGTYAARILSTGEVVPNAPSVSATAGGNGLVISWPDGTYVLQAATNVMGPWMNVVNATSPYTNSFAGGAQEFFRLMK